MINSFIFQSANGTYINGQRVQPKVFHTVRIGNALGISCHKTEDHEFEQNEIRFVYRLRRLVSVLFIRTL